MIRHLLLLAPLCACAATDRGDLQPTETTYAERELPLPAGGIVRAAIGDPRLPGGGWTRAQIVGSDVTISSLKVSWFTDEDRDGVLDSGESDFGYGVMGSHPIKRTMSAQSDRIALDGCDAVHINVDTTSGDVETVFALER